MIKKFEKQRAIKMANSLGFDIIDLAIIDGIECVGKYGEGKIVYWPIEREGSGFTQLFKNFSRWIE